MDTPHKIKYFKPILFFLSIILINSCHTTKKTIKAPLKAEGEKFIFEQLKNNSFDFNTFSAKASVKLFIDDKSNSFTVNLRIKKDSLIWLSISPALGIEIFRIIINKDSIKGIDRINSTYFISDYNYINEMFLSAFCGGGLNLDFTLLQNIILGNPCLLYEQELYKASIDKEEYLLTTHGRIHLKKNIPKESKRIIQKLWINPENFKISRMKINDFKENQKFELTYGDFKEISEKMLPYNHHYEIDTKKESESHSESASKRKPTQVFIEFSKIYVNKGLEFTFNIPEKYKRIE